MRKLSLLCILFILAGIFITSCSSNMSLTKRRYNKGYFVERHSNKHNRVKTAEESKLALQKTKTPIMVLPQKSGQLASQAKSVENIPQNKITASLNTEKQKNGKESKTGKNKFEKKAMLALALRNPVKTVKSLPEKIGTASAGDDALSLLWVIIVVLLILYLLSFLFDGFGLGGLVHLLAIIILVLLILWLLRLL